MGGAASEALPWKEAERWGGVERSSGKVLMGVDVVRLPWTYICVYACVCGTVGKVWPGLRVSTEITVSEEKGCMEKQGGKGRKDGRKGGMRRREGRHLVMICVY